MRRIFDIHTHIYPEKIAAKASVNLGNFYNFVVEGEGTYSHLEKQGNEYGVGGFLILGVATNPTQVTSVNDFIADTTELQLRNNLSGLVILEKCARCNHHRRANCI